MPRRSRGDDGRGDLAECPEPEGSNARKVAGQIGTPRPPDPIMRRPRADREEKRVTHGNGKRREEQLDPHNPNQRRHLGAISRRWRRCFILPSQPSDQTAHLQHVLLRPPTPAWSINRERHPSPEPGTKHRWRGKPARSNSPLSVQHGVRRAVSKAVSAVTPPSNGDRTGSLGLLICANIAP